MDVREAFEDYISVLGENAKNSIMHELTVQAGVNFAESKLSLAKLYEGLKILFGDEVAEIMIAGVVLRLEKINRADKHSTNLTERKS